MWRECGVMVVVVGVVNGCSGRGSGSKRRQRVDDEDERQAMQASQPGKPPGISVIAVQEESRRPMERGCPCARPVVRVEWDVAAASRPSLLRKVHSTSS